MPVNGSRDKLPRGFILGDSNVEVGGWPDSARCFYDVITEFSAFCL